MSAPKLPTLWVTLDDAIQVRESGEGSASADARRWPPPGGNWIEYVPASALEEATGALRLERAETARLRDVIWEAHDDLREVYVDHTDAKSSRLYRAALDGLSAALSPRPGAKES